MGLSLHSSTGSDDAPDMAEINIIPLVDIMLVLLIIFMVAAPMSISGIHISLPKSQASGGLVDEKRIVLSVNAQGDYYIEKTLIPKGTLRAKMKAIFEFRENKTLYIRADKSVRYGRVMEAMNAAKLAGVAKLSMLTELAKNDQS